MSSAYSDSFTSSFLTWMSFISFLCLIALAKTYNTTVNKSDKSGHPSLVPDFSGKSFTFSLLNIMLAVGFSNMVFIM